MFTRPDDLSDHTVAAAVRDGWGIGVTAIEYAPVGFGSHHWRAANPSARWFVTVDDLDARLLGQGDSRPAALDRLTAALTTAHELQSGGCAFVVAPMSSSSGRVVEAIDDRYVLAVYPHVEGVAGSFGRFGTRAERLAVVDLLLRLHEFDRSVPARTADFAIPSRDRLHGAMADVTAPWETGPFGQRARDLLAQHRGALEQALTAHDELVETVRSTGAPLVVSHGEPHPGNAIVTPAGPVLIDWDTALLAPPERDLWSLVDQDPAVRHHYERAAGRPLDDNALRAHRLWWDLCEVALFIDDFRRPHGETDDTRTAWHGLCRHLDPDRWADLI